MMLRTMLVVAGLSVAAGLTAAPASAMPLGGGVNLPATVENVQWYDDRPRWHRRGPPPWAPAWGRRYRDRTVYRYRGGPRYFYGGPRYRAYGYGPRYRTYGYGPRDYYGRPTVTFRF